MSDVGPGAEVVSCTAVPMKQMPAGNIVAESPLHYAGPGAMAGCKPGVAGIVFQQRADLGLLTLRLNASNTVQLEIFKQLMGTALPTQPLSSSVIGDSVVRWQSPDEWLVTVPREAVHDVEMRFCEAMPGHYALVNISGGFTVWQLSGEKVTDLLRKCVPVDLHPAEFPVGKVVSTLFAKSGATLRRQEVDTFELVVRRSYADYLWRWIQDASREFGLVVEM